MNLAETKAAALAAILAGAAGCTAADPAVPAMENHTDMDKEHIHLVPCPKCDKRMRILDNCKEANVNLSRLQDGSPSPEELDRRIAAMKARAQRFINMAARPVTGDRRCPLMGWSSWNTFAVDISHELIEETARAMAANGLRDAGYLYVNIDDGYFCGHDESGRLRIHTGKFPGGLRPLVDAIHALGLRAGIYSDAGVDTCGSAYNNDTSGRGSGLYGHDMEDCRFFFEECAFDFIKVDYCGGQWLGLDERRRYTEISQAIREAGKGNVRFNICRWAYPGTWVADVADSWRTTYDIRANWQSIRSIIAENMYLGAFAGPGRFNDMDMLEVGQPLGRNYSVFKNDTGLSPEEETTHFGMWCMMSSPLLIGCDVRTIPERTRRLVTNPYLVAMDQNNGLGVQGYVARREGDAYVLVKDAEERFGRSRYVAIYNSGDCEAAVTIDPRDLDLGGNIQAFDLVEKADVGEFSVPQTFHLPKHAARFYLFDAEKRLERTIYEAETAYLGDYQELDEGPEAGTARHRQMDGASGGVVVEKLGGRESNDLVWKEVAIFEDGARTLDFRVCSPERRTFFVQIDGGKKTELVCEGGESVRSVKMSAHLAAGLHEIRVSNGSAPCPDVDALVIAKEQ